MMSGRALLLDIGNTRLKWGVLQNGELVKTGSITHERIRDSGFEALTRRLPRKVDRVLASNVAGPAFAARLSSVIGIHCDAELRFAQPAKSGHGVTNGYRRPRQLGADRWAAMIGARASWKSALCIVDAGTAITVDAVDRDGHHLGGQIIPGLHLMADALKRGTKGMRELRIRRSDPGTGMELFSNNTEGAVPAGALNAICGGIERSLKIMRADGLRPRAIFTGGGAPRIMSAIDQKSTHCPHLVLQGLAVMLLESSR